MWWIVWQKHSCVLAFCINELELCISLIYAHGLEWYQMINIHDNIHIFYIIPCVGIIFDCYLISRNILGKECWHWILRTILCMLGLIENVLFYWYITIERYVLHDSTLSIMLIISCKIICFFALLLLAMQIITWSHCNLISIWVSHDEVIKWKHFPHYWPFVRGIGWFPVNSPHKGHWRRVLCFLWSASE